MVQRLLSFTACTSMSTTPPRILCSFRILHRKTIISTTVPRWRKTVLPTTNNMSRRQYLSSAWRKAERRRFGTRTNQPSEYHQHAKDPNYHQPIPVDCRGRPILVTHASLTQTASHQRNARAGRTHTTRRRQGGGCYISLNRCACDINRSPLSGIFVAIPPPRYGE